MRRSSKGGMPFSSATVIWFTGWSLTSVASAQAASMARRRASVADLFSGAEGPALIVIRLVIWPSLFVVMVVVVVAPYFADQLLIIPTNSSIAPSSAICVCVSGFSSAISESARAAISGGPSVGSASQPTKADTPPTSAISLAAPARRASCARE